MAIRIFNQDCMQFMKMLGDNTVTLTLTDIPYAEVNRTSYGLRNLDKEKADTLGDIDLDYLVDELVRVTDGSIYMFCGINQISGIRMRMQYHSLSTRLCIWEKSNPSPMNGQYIWLSGVEACVFGKKPKATFNSHCKNTVWNYPSGQSNSHPTQKPLAMFRTLIEASSNRQDMVFDPFLGSGTTGVAAKLLGRSFIGCELNQEYFEYAQQRINDTQSGDGDDLFTFS